MTVNVDLFGDLDSVARDAGDALERGAQPLFFRLQWFRLLERHCSPPGRLLVLRAEAGGRRSWLFLAVEGARATAYAAWYSLRVGPVGEAGDDVMAALGGKLRSAGIAALDLAPVEDPEPLRRGLRSAGWIVAVEEKTGNWIADTEGFDFDSWWAERPGRLRSTVRRRAKAAGLEVEVHRAFDADAWAAYEAVYRASWKPDEGSFPFLRALAEQEAAAGALRLGIARKDGAPVAAQLWTVEDGKAIIHKLAYAEEAKALSPGTILSEAMFRHAIDEDRVRRIDYGTGDEPYKADWMDRRRPLWRVTAWNPRTLRGLAGAAKARLGSSIRNLRSQRAEIRGR